MMTRAVVIAVEVTGFGADNELLRPFVARALRSYADALDADRAGARAVEALAIDERTTVSVLHWADDGC